MSVATKKLKQGLDQARGALSKFGGSISPATAALGGLAVAAGGAVAAVLTIDKLNETMQEMAATGKLAQRIGADTEALSGLQYAAQASGLEVDSFNDAISDMTEKLGDARMGGGEAGEVLDALGLSVNELAGQDPTQAFTTIAEEISKLENQADKLTLSDKLFGGDGQKMIPFLDRGKEGIDELVAKAEELGLTFNDIDAAKIQMANQAVNQLKAGFEGVWRQLAINLAPFITAFANNLQKMGLNGKSASGLIITGLEMVAKGIAFAADGVGLFELGWLAMKKVFFDVNAAVLSGLAFMAKKIQTILNKIPGVSVSFGTALDGMAEQARQKAREAGVALNEELIKPSAGEKVTRFFNKVKADSEAAAQKLAEDSKKTNEIVGSTFEANTQGQEVIKSLESQIREMQMGAEAAKVFELRQAGVSDKIIKQVEALQAQKKALEDQAEAAKEAEKKQEDLKRSAERLTESFKTPIEKIGEQFDELQTLFSKGLIDETTFNRAAADLIEKGINANGGPFEMKFAGTAELGSQEARDAILRSRIPNSSGNDPLKQVAQTNKDQLEQIKKMPGLLQKIVDATQANQTVSI